MNDVPTIPFHDHPDGSRHAGRRCGTCPPASRPEWQCPRCRQWVRVTESQHLATCTNSGRVYCTKGHADGEHDASCLPPADRNDPELRLLRAIFGLCSLCDVEEPHSHVPEDRP